MNKAASAAELDYDDHPDDNLDNEDIEVLQAANARLGAEWLDMHDALQKAYLERYDARNWARNWKRAAKVNRFTLIQSGAVNDRLRAERNEAQAEVERLRESLEICRAELCTHRTEEWRLRKGWEILDKATITDGWIEVAPQFVAKMLNGEE